MGRAFALRRCRTFLEKSVRKLGAIRRVDGAARVSLRPSSCNRCAWTHFGVNGLFVGVFLWFCEMVRPRFSISRQSISHPSILFARLVVLVSWYKSPVRKAQLVLFWSDISAGSLVFALHKSQLRALAGEFSVRCPGSGEQEGCVNVAEACHRRNSGFPEKSSGGAEYLHRDARL
ncbi:hypothetical protein VN12_05590 [Pirellula sp. SH-Sr6A]|nr:hypothetical protein VN12_05590 [Pirellula sp. SH-Sr6A]